ncbi:unnamed protein product [Lupinus luteus]|uniref:Alpha/beta hydrolase fold-3 domain-containing protein n=1 Tax=Lupinus luteus TaxID=3873 RepID=A0AAV1W1V9_LUPLU
MSNQTSSQSEANNIGNPYELFKLVYNPNNQTLTRMLEYPFTSPTSDLTLPISVLSKDVTINQINNTWARLFLPRRIALAPNHKKLPLIVFFHGSGFIIGSASNTMFHDLCVEIADTIEAVVASVEYRLAPEHRLPAAFDDAMETLSWVTKSQDEWLIRYVDYSNCYVMGNSAGATIAYQAGLNVAEEVDDFEPLKIRGLILRQPFFGGTKRSESELRLMNNKVLPLCVTDMLWDLALPIGATRDHEYCNLFVGNAPKKLYKIKELGIWVLVSGNGGDILVDCAKDLVQLMVENGVNVVSDFQEEGHHEVEYDDPLEAKRLIGLVKSLIFNIDA